MFGALMAGIAAVQLAGHPTLMLDQARHMSANALAGALLAPDHPSIVDSRVHPLGMEAPMPWVVSVEFMTRPEANSQAGLCEAQIVTVHFAPTEKWIPEQGKPLPARPTGVTERTIDRIPNGRLDDQSCQAPRENFLEVLPSQADRQLEMLRMFAAARSGMLRMQNVDHVTFEDRVKPDGDPISDPQSALEKAPSDAVFWVNLRPQQYELGDATKQALQAAGPNAEVALLSANGWQIELVHVGNRMLHIHLVRRIPPPF